MMRLFPNSQKIIIAIRHLLLLLILYCTHILGVMQQTPPTADCHVHLTVLNRLKFSGTMKQAGQFVLKMRGLQSEFCHNLLL